MIVTTETMVRRVHVALLCHDSGRIRRVLVTRKYNTGKLVVESLVKFHVVQALLLKRLFEKTDDWPPYADIVKELNAMSGDEGEDDEFDINAIVSRLQN